MGASGAGKTTLLNILACRIPFTSEEEKKSVGVAFGRLTANNQPISY